MKLTPTDIDVTERNDEVVSLSLTLRKTTGELVPYNLTNTALELYVKNSTNDSDANAVLLYTSVVGGRIVITDALNGKIEIRFAAADLPAPGQFVYHLDSVTNGLRRTLVIGTLTIHNI